eukprot:9964683-Alexandrium_andersonii.AAC.1
MHFACSCASARAVRASSPLHPCDAICAPRQVARSADVLNQAARPETIDMAAGRLEGAELGPEARPRNAAMCPAVLRLGLEGATSALPEFPGQTCLRACAPVRT